MQTEFAIDLALSEGKILPRPSSESYMLVTTSAPRYENARKPLMALILTFSQWEKELMGVPSFILFIPVTAKRSLVLLRKRCIYRGLILQQRLA